MMQVSIQIAVLAGRGQSLMKSWLLHTQSRITAGTKINLPSEVTAFQCCRFNQPQTVLCFHFFI